MRRKPGPQATRAVDGPSLSWIPASRALIPCWPARSCPRRVISAAARVTVAAPVSRPASNIDQPAVNSVVPPWFDVAGWAIDLGAEETSGVDAVHVCAYPSSGSAPLFLGAATVGPFRPDVAAVFGSRFEASGFRLSVSGVAPGSYTLVVYARSTVSGVFTASTRALTVRPAGNPLMTIDTPRAWTEVTGSFLIAGWAIDLDAVHGPGIDAVHAWAYPEDGSSPVWLGAAALRFRRPDVGEVYGAAVTDAGYNLAVQGGTLRPGTYRLAVSARSIISAAFDVARVVDVVVR